MPASASPRDCSNRDNTTRSYASLPATTRRAELRGRQPQLRAPPATCGCARTQDVRLSGQPHACTLMEDRTVRSAAGTCGRRSGAQECDRGQADSAGAASVCTTPRSPAARAGPAGACAASQECHTEISVLRGSRVPPRPAGSSRRPAAPRAQSLGPPGCRPPSASRGESGWLCVTEAL